MVSAGKDSVRNLPCVDCDGIDSFFMLHSFEKSLNVKTGKGLVDSVYPLGKQQNTGLLNYNCRVWHISGKFIEVKNARWPV